VLFGAYRYIGVGLEIESRLGMYVCMYVCMYVNFYSFLKKKLLGTKSDVLPHTLNTCVDTTTYIY
jgi:hypothetical protein